MFKIAKLEKVNNEKVSINLITYEQSKYEKGEKILTEIVKTLSFDISGDNYSLGFDLNCKLEELLELRKKIKDLERDNDILKKGLAIFAQLQEKE